MAEEKFKLSDLRTKLSPTDITIDTCDLNSSCLQEEKCVKIKAPRRVLHFSDGILEEFSTDEDDDVDAKIKKDANESTSPSELKKLPWGPWMWYWVAVTSSSALAACDYVGETLANVLGITSPKYQYEIEEYKRVLLEEAETKKQESQEMSGWTTTKSEKVVPVQEETIPTITQPPLSTSQAPKQALSIISSEDSHHLSSKSNVTESACKQTESEKF